MSLNFERERVLEDRANLKQQADRITELEAENADKQAAWVSISNRAVQLEGDIRELEAKNERQKQAIEAAYQLETALRQKVVDTEKDTARLDWIAEAMPREDKRDLRTIIDEQIANRQASE